MRDSLVYWTTREPESDVRQHENGSRSESSCPRHSSFECASGLVY